MYRFVPLSLVLFIGLLNAAAPPFDPTRAPVSPADAAIIEAAKKDSSLKANLLYLSDEIGPRLTGSEALNRACRWAAERMKSYGLENVQLEPYTIPEGWERGTASARLVEPANGVRIKLESYGWRPGTDGKVTGEIVVIPAPSIKELQKLKGKLKGKIVMSGPPSRVRGFDELNKGGASPFGGPLVKGQPRPNYAEMMAYSKERDSFLMREGALALLLDSAKPFNLVVTTGGWRGTDRPSATHKLPTLSVAHDNYAMLYRLAMRPEPAKTKLELEVTNKFIPGPIKVFNVVGEIKGKDRPDESVILGAHLDSWDLGQGTTDNGTGSCIVLEAARMLKASGQAPQRTIRFCLFTGEEQGLIGSRQYVQKHKEAMKKVSAALIHDVGTGRIKGLGVGNRPAIAKLLQQELAVLRTLGVADFTTRSFPGSDHQSFEQLGVPGLMMVQEPAYYFVSHHTAADTPERLLEADLVQGATVMALSAARIANLENLLPRDLPKATRPRISE